MALIRKCIMKGFIACLQCVRLGADCLTDVSTLSHITAFVDCDVKLDLHQVTCFVFTATEKLYVLPLVSALRDSEEKTRKWREWKRERARTGPGNGTGQLQTYVPMGMCTTHYATAPAATEEIEGDVKNTTQKVGHLEIKRYVRFKER